MEYKKIEAINSRLAAVDIKGKPYNTVNQRVLAFRELFENGSIETELVSLSDGICTMKAVVKNDEGRVIATGYAQEKESSSFINKTSYVENCETSAVGRALGFIGIGATDAIASAEEVQNAVLNQGKDKDNNERGKASKTMKCRRCGEEITEAERAASVLKYKIPLCPECRKAAEEYAASRINPGKEAAAWEVTPS